ncbi:hypothetical protein HMI56_005909 [Coelomomyces lativittatus]|nr:hypothetical protein HMI56_005909 [Coelomomyces lativittatus]
MDLGKFLTSKKVSIWEQLEDSFFFLYYMIHEKTRPAYVHPTRTALAVELIMTFIHFGGYILGANANYGNVTYFWGRFVRILQFRIETINGSYLPLFLSIFWLLNSLILIVVMICLFTSITFNRGIFRIIWPLNVLHFLLIVLLRHLFVCVLSVLLTPWFCLPSTFTLYYFPDIPCFTNTASVIVGLVLSLIFLFLLISYIMTQVEHKFIPNALLACTSPYFQVSLLLSKIAFVIQGDYMGRVINGPWWEIFCYCVLLIFLYLLLLYKLPFQNQVANYGFASVLSMLNWLAACSFISVHMSPNPFQETRALDLLMIIGLLPAALLGVAVLQLRINYVQNIVEFIQLHHTDLIYGNNFDEMAQPDYKMSSKEMAENFLKEKRLKPYTNSMNYVEILGRYLIQLKKYEAAEIWYRAALIRYPVSTMAHVLYLNYIDLSKKHQSSSETDNIEFVEITSDSIANFQPVWYLRFYVFRMKMEADKDISTSKIGNIGHRLDLLQYVEFSKSFQTARKYHRECIDSIQQFWLLFLGNDLSFENFKLAVRTINEKTTLAEAFYNSLLSRYPKSPKILQAYANFASLILNDSNTAENYHQLASNAQARELEMEKENSGFGADKTSSFTQNAVITIDIEGLIQEVNLACIQLFGYTSKNELLQRKINLLIPLPYKRSHDGYLQRFKKTGVKKVIGIKRSVYGLHRLGHSFLMDLNIVELKKREKLFAGLISPRIDHPQKACICIDKVGTIQFINREACQMFGYTPAELVGNNLKMIMSKEYESQHDIYLRKYLETGEAKVIGMGIRNVKGVHKSGKFISIGLEVRKEVWDEEIYYLGTLVDVDELEGEILINAFGEIKSFNEAALVILGYKRGEVLGKNIKFIMPEPYFSFHDRYLERYRRTRKAVIVNNKAGRVVSVRNKSGICFPVHLQVKKLEQASEILFQGALKRVSMAQLESENGGSIQNMIIVTQELIVKHIGSNISSLLELGTNTVIDKPLGQIFPPCPSLPYQGDVRTMVDYLLDFPESYHYAYFVRKSRNLFPCGLKALYESDGTIKIQMEELLSKEGIIKINEKGTILDSNPAIHFLFGYNEEELTGRNVKMIMPAEVAKEHDFYLKRYLETKIKTVVGIPRTLKGWHKDDVFIPLSLEVVESNVDGDRYFLARIRHGNMTTQKLDVELYRMIMGITSPDDLEENSMEISDNPSLEELETKNKELVFSSSSRQSPEPVADDGSISPQANNQFRIRISEENNNPDSSSRNNIEDSDDLSPRSTIERKDTESLASSTPSTHASMGISNVRDMQLIMMWKNSKSNPLHNLFQRHSFNTMIIIFTFLIVMTAATGAIFNYALESHGVLVLGFGKNLNRIYFSIEQFKLCTLNSTSTFCTSRAPHNWTEEWSELLDTHKHTLLDILLAFDANAFQEFPNDLPVKEFTLSDENASVEKRENFLVLNVGIISSLGALIFNSTYPKRNLNFLLQNKDVAITTVRIIADTFLKNLEKRKRLACYIYTGFSSSFILIILVRNDFF